MISPVYLEGFVLVLGLVLLLWEAFSNSKDKRPIAWTGIAGLAACFIATFILDAGAELPAFYSGDHAAVFYKRLALLSTIGVLVMAVEYRHILSQNTEPARAPAGIGEYFTIPVFTCAGLMWMASAQDFIMLFVSLELVTVSFYVLVSFMRRNSGSLEAGTKYLILGALSTGFLVYGITWIFGATGQTNLESVARVAASEDVNQTAILFGMLLVGIALGFKIAAAPFQLWVADVYQGAPTPTTAFLSVGSKAAGFIVLMRVLDVFAGAPVLHQKVLTAAAILAGATLVYGNFAAMPQNNLKRLLAYSSIGQAGYLLVAVTCVDSTAVSFYLGAYLLMTLLAFLVLTVVAHAAGGEEISHFNGLSKRSPLLAFGMLVAMLSLAGLPFTAGFLGKFFVFAAAVNQERWVLVALGAVSVACGFYYYLKVVRAMYWKGPENREVISVAPLTRISVIAAAVLVILFGVFPQPLFALLSR
jgi:NADH-quinone oxidoreductase subunit N